MNKNAVTRMQAIIIAIIVIVVVVAGVVVYYYAVPPAPTPPTPPPTPPTPPPPTLPPKDKIVIGYAASLTGPYAAGEVPKQKIIYEMIVDKWNGKGGIYVPEYGKKLPIEILIEDAKSDIETYIRLFEKFATVDKVDWVFSAYGTASHYAVAPIVQKYKYPLITLTAMSDKLSTDILKGTYTYLFLVQRNARYTAKDAADFILHTGVKKVGVIYILELFGIEGSGALYTYLTDKGVRPLIYEGYPRGVADLSPLIKKLKDAGVEALVAWHYPADMHLLIKQCIELDYSPKIFIGGDGIDMPAVVIPAFGTKIPNGTMCLWGWDNYEKPASREFAEEYKRRTGYYPAPHQIGLYVAYDTAFSMIEKYGLNREKIRDVLATQTFDTILGKARFDPELGFIWEGRGALGQWQGGEKMEVVWPLEYATAKWIFKPPWPKE